jgi:hypothetical protein
MVAINAELFYRNITNSKLSRRNFNRKLTEDLEKAYIKI